MKATERKPTGRIRRWIKRKEISDYYMCRVCRRILDEEEMCEEDKSICKQCNRD